MTNRRPSLICINQPNHPNDCSLPPPLETSMDDQNKENIPHLAPPLHPNTNNNHNNNTKAIINKAASKSLEAVPALEIFHEEEPTADSKYICPHAPPPPPQRAMSASASVIVEEEEESGDILSPLAIASASEEEKKSSEELSDDSYTILANGRLMESEEDWYKRAAVTTDAADGKMTFRPLRMKCTHCDEAYTKTHDLYAHIRSHQNHTKCPHCGKILTCMATFVYHVRTHTGEKPYYCPVAGCDFKNAVKYNLKVHLACIRHGGKANLKKYAKVLDLDVCEKSLRKRKDDSVHELGSRRSKKRRKLNKSSNGNSSNNGNVNSHSHGHQQMQASQGYNGGMVMGGGGGFYAKQEEYDQFAAQLLFSLSGMGAPAASVYGGNQDMNQAMDWTMNMNMAQLLSMNQQAQVQQQPPQLPPMQMQMQLPLPIDSNGNVIKTEPQMPPLQQGQDGAMASQQQQFMMKPEQQQQQFMNYDPMMYAGGYYAQQQMGMAAPPQLPPPQQNEDKQQAMLQSLSTSTMWDSHQEQQMQMAKEEKIEDNSENVLVPKQEPMYPAEHGGMDPMHAQAQAQAMQMNQQYLNPSSYDPMQQQMNMNMYYANVNAGYYQNYQQQQHQLLYNPMNQNPADEMNKNIEVPPMPMPMMENE